MKEIILSLFFLLTFSFLLTPQASAATSPFSFSFPFPSSIINFPKPSATPAPSISPSSTPTLSPQPSPVSTVFKLNSITPTTANFSQEITLKGSMFGATQGSIIFFERNSPVKLAGAPINTWSDTEIKAKVPALKGSTYYDVAVEKSDKTLSNKLKVRVRNGQPQVFSTSTVKNNSLTRITLRGEEFGSRDGLVLIYDSGNNLVQVLEPDSWSSSKIIFTIPEVLTPGQYYYQLETEDLRLSSTKSISVF